MTHIQGCPLTLWYRRGNQAGLWEPILDPCRCSVSPHTGHHSTPSHIFSRTGEDLRFYVLSTSLSETGASLWRETSCPWSVKIRKLSATSLGNYKTPISTQDLSTVAHQLPAPLNSFYGSVRVVTGPCHYRGVCCFFHVPRIWQEPSTTCFFTTHGMRD